jgi:hypothetical protein
MSLPNRPKGESPRAWRENGFESPPGRPEGESLSAPRMPSPVSHGPLLYGLFFCGVVPVLLVVVAAQTASWTTLAVPAPWVGWLAAATGAAVMSAGLHGLIVFGRGLPMNAYPPAIWVRRGVYRWLEHPIYLGFVLLVCGVSTLCASASGVWIVTPLAALGCIALLAGYELPATARRFGDDRPRALWTLPAAVDATPTAAQRLAVYPLLFGPWLVGYEAFVLIGPPSDAFSVVFALEASWPVIEWTEVIYAGCYVWIAAAPLWLRTQAQLRALIQCGWLGSAIGFGLFAVVPAIAPWRPFVPATWLGELILFERSKDSIAAALPSFHAFWGWIAAALTARAWPRLRAAAWMAGGAVAVSCVTTGTHATLDVLAGSALAALAWQRERVWRGVLQRYEALANSWTAWHIGRLRIISHAPLAALAACIGVAVAAAFAPPKATWVVALAALCALLGGALWAQWVEGSPRLLRPFGFFGAVVGYGFGAVVFCVLLGVDLNEVAAATALGAPWAIALGRLRCAVQGCCHGRPALRPHCGVVHENPHSRVCALATLRGVPLHPTPLYALLAHAVIGVLLLRLAWVGWSGSMLLATFVVLTAIERFAEEAYRGEPQTAYWRGLSLYQWLALGLCAIGIALAFVAPGAPVAVGPVESAELALVLIAGTLAGLAMGVDVPASKLPFARLTG